MRRLGPLSTRCLLAAAALATWACAEPAKTSPNVLIIVLDTVRADHLSCYGYARETSPFLDRFASDARRYTHAYSTSSWTAPGHASLFTGLYSIAHHATQENWKLATEIETMAEILSGSGYRTLAVVENPVLSRGNGFAQGFDRFVQTWRAKDREPRAASTVDLFDQLISTDDTAVPFFGFVNLIAAHSPYDPPADVRDRFLTDPTFALRSNKWAQFYSGELTFTPQELIHLRELYDGEIFVVDRTSEQIIELLARRDLVDDTIIVITSDHGENFGENDHVDHVFSVYEPTLRIPLLIRYPRRIEPGSVEDHPVQLTDILPTILELVGVPAAGLELQGDDLLKSRAGGRRFVFGEYYRPRQAFRAMRRRSGGGEWQPPAGLDRRLRTVIRDSMKLIWASDGRHELFDLSADPAEQEDCFTLPGCAAAKHDLLRLLKGAVALYGREPPGERSAEEEPLDPETQEALRALGYLQ